MMTAPMARANAYFILMNWLILKNYVKDLQDGKLYVLF